MNRCLRLIMQNMKEKIEEVDSRKLCAFQEIKIRDHKEYYAECKLMYSSKNPIWGHECNLDICPMYQAWKLLEMNQVKEKPI